MDYSSTSLLLSCPRSYEESQVNKLAPTTERISRRFGDAWHGILYQYGRGNEAGVAKVIEAYQESPGDYRTKEKLRLGFERYRERYAESPLEYVSHESSFKVYMAPGIDEPLEGRRDAIAWWDANQGYGKELWVVDYKTTSVLRADWVDFYRNSNQFKNYYLATQTEWPEVAGVLVDVYHATKGNQRGKTPEEKEGNRFYRLPIRYEKFKLQEAVRDFAVASTTKKMYDELGYYPKNTAACHQFGSACPFLELCDAASEESRERLRATYAPNTFDPHAPMET